MNENQNEIQNENQEQSQETHKHFLTLHISHKGQQKTLHFRIRHAVAVCAATVFLVGGSVCAVGAYQKTKTDLHTSKEQLLETERERRKLEQRAELLETENTEYTENIDALQNKTTELEQKINEIESVKEDLYHQITNLDESDSSASLDLTAMTSALAPTEGTEAAAPTFTTLVSTSYNKASALSTHLDKMSLLMDETSISFSAVADTVTYLAALSNAPSGCLLTAVPFPQNSIPLPIPPSVTAESIMAWISPHRAESSPFMQPHRGLLLPHSIIANLATML